MRNNPQAPPVVETGTLMQKPIPPRLVEPYLTGRRAVIAGFVYRAADTSFTEPADFYTALDLGYDGSEFRPDMTELYVLRWTSATLGGLPDPLLRRARRRLDRKASVHRDRLYVLAQPPHP